MRITHRHGQARVTQYFLQRENVAASLNEVAGKAMPERMTSLPLGQIDTRTNQCPPKRTDSASQDSSRSSILKGFTSSSGLT
jgi:hypothetical protein